MGLRYYQEDAVRAVYEHLRHKDTNPCVEMPVGSGKSWVLGQIASDTVKAWNGRALVVAGAKELLQQNAEKIRLVAPDIGVGICSAGLDRWEANRPVVVGGVQSIFRRVKEIGHRDVCIIDECHLIPPDGEGMYRTLLAGLKEINPKMRIVGCTATPYRLKGGMICRPENILNEICYRIDLKELIEKGFLSKLTAKSGRNIAKFDALHVRAGEFVAEEVERAMTEDAIVSSACREIVELTKDRKSVIVFCSSVAHCQKVAERISILAGTECAIVTGETPSFERAEILERFKGKSVQADLFGNEKPPLKFVCNVECLTTGFDAPNIDCVALLRPTMSPGLLMQMCGRGTRLSPETGKTDCLILDFGGNIERHGCLDCLRPPGEKTGEKRGPLAKACPKCQTMMPLPLMVCPECGFEFERKEKEVKIEATASTLGVISGETTFETLEVTHVDYDEWAKRGAPPDYPKTIRVTYWCGMNERHCEWVCPEHSGYARRKFVEWFKARRIAEDVFIPATAAEFLEAVFGGMVKTTKSITIRKTEGKRYADIVSSVVGDTPEGGPNDMNFEDGDLDDLPF
jgi:DNA repair protein RadD